MTVIGSTLSPVDQEGQLVPTWYRAVFAIHTEQCHAVVTWLEPFFYKTGN